MKRFFLSAVFSAAILTALPLSGHAAELIPVGKVIGLQLQDDTVTVAAYDDTLGARARDAGLKIGDEILTIDAVPIDSAQDVRSALETCDDDAEITVRRGSHVSTITVYPIDTADGPRLGIYLRQGIAGIGTVTFYDPATHVFGTLGHGVSDAKGNLLHMVRGSAFDASILSVTRGKSGHPGQLKGAASDPIPFAPLLRNTPQGVFGTSETGWPGEPISTAAYDDIRTGPATIRSTVSSGTTQEYSVEILKIYPFDRTDGRNFLIKVTDPALLETTGGIVQGMSGSPILQDGKLIGAVTHVLVNDPAMGYGIFIENMLDAAE